MRRSGVFGLAAVGALVVATMLTHGPSTLKLQMPIYGTTTTQGWSEMTSRDYSELAEFDVAILGHHTLLGKQYDGLVDSVRVRNKDWVYLVYFWVFGAREDWKNSSSIYGDIYGMIDRNDFWMRDIDGQRVNHAPYNSNAYMFEPGAEGLADSLANICVSYLKERDNLRHHVGVFLDWLSSPYPHWAIAGTGFDRIDFNRNGIPYSQDFEDELLNRKYIEDVAKAFRKAAGRSDFLLVPNGSAFRDEEFAGLFDGGMHELVSRFYPSGKAQWTEALSEVSKWCDNSRVSPPLVFFHDTHDSAGYATEALASIGNGVCVFPGLLGTSKLPDRKLNLGKRLSDPIWDNDIVRATFHNGKVQTTVSCLQGNFIWPYLMRTTDGDTISRGGRWPAEVPPDALEEILIIYSQWLKDHYGEKIDLTTLQMWTETATAIHQECQ